MSDVRDPSFTLETLEERVERLIRRTDASRLSYLDQQDVNRQTNKDIGRLQEDNMLLKTLVESLNNNIEKLQKDNMLLKSQVESFYNSHMVSSIFECFTVLVVVFIIVWLV